MKLERHVVSRPGLGFHWCESWRSLDILGQPYVMRGTLRGQSLKVLYRKEIGLVAIHRWDWCLWHIPGPGGRHLSKKAFPGCKEDGRDPEPTCLWKILTANISKSNFLHIYNRNDSYMADLLQRRNEKMY